MQQFRYKAFVSYSWADAEWGKWLLHAIESYRTPAAMVGKEGNHGPVPARLHPLFKDREEEAAGASIGAAVEAALLASEFLIVICSPRSARSQWVNREIAWFKTHRDPNNVLALIVDGNPGSGGALECFPKALTHKVDSDLTISDEPLDAPLAADARITGDGKRGARLKLAAAMLGVGLGELVNREDRRRALRTRIVVGGSLALALTMGTMAWYAIRARNEAQVQRGQAEGLVEFMIGDLRKKLQPKVQIEVLGSIADRAQAFYAVQSKYPMDAEALARRARVLKLLADLEVDRGRSEQSLALFRQSVAASGELLKRDPDNPDRILEQAFALQSLGNVSFQHGDLIAAERYMQEAVDLTGHLIRDIGQDSEWMAEHGSALANLGIVQFQQNQNAKAEANLGEAIAIKRKAVRLEDPKHAGWIDFAVTLEWSAQAAERMGKAVIGRELRKEGQAIYSRLIAADGDDQVARSYLTVSQFKQAEALVFEDPGGALAIARTADAAAKQSLTADPKNLSVVDDAAGAALVLAQAELQNGNSNAAAHTADLAEALAMQLLDDDPSNLKWSGPLLGFARLTGIAAKARLASGRSCQAVLSQTSSEVARLEKLRSAHPLDLKLNLVTARGQMMFGDARILAGNEQTALQWWQRADATMLSLYGAREKISDPAGRFLAGEIGKRQAEPRAPLARGAVCGYSQVNPPRGSPRA